MISLSVRNIEKLNFYMLQVYFNCLFIQWKVVTHLYFPWNSRGMLIIYEAQTKTLTQHNTDTSSPVVIEKIVIIECKYVCRCQTPDALSIRSVSDT